MSVALTSFIVFAASQIGTPGPANMALMATGARFGFRAALPFVAGVALGKQLVIWPVGFGLMQLADRAPGVFVALKFASAAYIIWLAWKVPSEPKLLTVTTMRRFLRHTQRGLKKLTVIRRSKRRSVER